MVFSSFQFLFQFLPIFLLIYFISPKPLKNPVIFLGSLVFYYYGVIDHPSYVLLMLFAVLINYVMALCMEKTSTTAGRRVFLIIGLTYNIGCLAAFKYLGIAALPVGISFYTFQISSYLIDVYWKKFPAENSLITLGTYLCLFPQLIAGPIVTYAQIRTQLHRRVHSYHNFENGLRLFTIGLSLKVLIANRIGGLWTQVASIGYESISTPLAWMGLFAFTFQIYFDFYGYSLMAKGLGQIMGFNFPKNFSNPYLAKSMTDFWRRWHITLGSWFREYVYIPLGGNRHHLYRNLFIVWFLTGMWHGAGWNFILWGLSICVLICIEKSGLGKFLEKHGVLGHLYMLFVIPLSWLLFAVNDFSNILIYLQRLFPFFGQSGGAVFAGDYLKYGKQYGLVFLVAVFFCSILPEKLYKKYRNSFVATLILVILFWACVYCMYLGMDDPFLYYQF